MDREIASEEVRLLLKEFARRLARLNRHIGVRVVGGAAVSLHGFDRRPTYDVDAVVLPWEAAEAVISEMAVEFGLQATWLNDSAKFATPAVGLEDWCEVLRIDDVTVSIASLELLLAMKLYANRASRDWDDIHFLLDACDIRSVEQAQEIYERYHAQDVIADTAVVRLQAWLAAQGLD